jgi:hypothetical protein
MHQSHAIYDVQDNALTGAGVRNVNAKFDFSADVVFPQQASPKPIHRLNLEGAWCQLEMEVEISSAIAMSAFPSVPQPGDTKGSSSAEDRAGAARQTISIGW